MSIFLFDSNKKALRPKGEGLLTPQLYAFGVSGFGAGVDLGTTGVVPGATTAVATDLRLRHRRKNERTSCRRKSERTGFARKSETTGRARKSKRPGRTFKTFKAFRPNVRTGVLLASASLTKEKHPITHATAIKRFILQTPI